VIHDYINPLNILARCSNKSNYQGFLGDLYDLCYITEDFINNYRKYLRKIERK